MAADRPLSTIRAGGHDLPAIVDKVAALAPGRVLVDSTMVAAAARAWTANTIRAFLSDPLLWEAWCRAAGLPPGEGTPQAVAAYVRALAGESADTPSAAWLNPRGCGDHRPLPWPT